MKSNNLIQGLIIGGGIVAISLALAFAEKAHMLGEFMSLRITMALSALIVAYYGNAIPKAVFRSARAAAVRRFAGWVFVISGLACAATWIFAPLAIAYYATFVLGGGFALVLGYCLWSRTTGRSQAR